LNGGNNDTGASDAQCWLFGDADTLADTAKGGNDRLIAETAESGGSVINYMFGDAQTKSATAVGGRDTFVFHGDFVGTRNYVGDFHQAEHDRIEFRDVTGVDSFADLVIAADGGDTVITAGADQVTLVNFTGTLTQADFLFG
jgi:hypothetical protein